MYGLLEKYRKMLKKRRKISMVLIVSFGCAVSVHTEALGPISMFETGEGICIGLTQDETQ